MASSNRHWPSMFKSNKPCAAHQWQQHDMNPSSFMSSKPFANSAGGSVEERTPEPKPRWNPKPEQIRILEGIFNSGMVNPPRDEIRRIRAQLQEYGHVGDANVFYWFQNRKSRSKHKQRQLHSAASRSSSTTSRSSSSGSDKTPPPPPATAAFSGEIAAPRMLPEFLPEAPLLLAAAPLPAQYGYYSFSDLLGLVGVSPPAPAGSGAGVLWSEMMMMGQDGFGKMSGSGSSSSSSSSLPVASSPPSITVAAAASTTTTTNAAASVTTTIASSQASTCIASPVNEAQGTLERAVLGLAGAGDVTTAAVAKSAAIPEAVAPGMSSMAVVFINEVPFEVAAGPLNLRDVFGDGAVLIHSSGHPVVADEWGVTLHPLQHGAFYYLL